MKRILYILLAVALIGGAYGYYLWNKPHRDMASAKTDLSVAAADLYREFNADEAAANAKYLDKVIAVKGVVKESSKDAEGTVKVSLETGAEFSVRCELDAAAQHARTDFPAGETITLKGTCSGLNFDVVFDRCVEVKN